MNPLQITHALLLVKNTSKSNSSYDAIYGGETLLNRSLIALSMSGIRKAVIVTSSGNKERIEEMIRMVKHRLVLDYAVAAHDQGQVISEKIREVIAQWDDPFLMFETDKFIHPTFIKQTITANPSSRAVAFAYKYILIKENALYYDASFKERFKIIFANTSGYNKFLLENDDFKIFDSSLVDLTDKNQLVSFSERGDGVFSCDAGVFRKKHLEGISDYKSLGEAFQQLIRKNLLAIQFVTDAWWMRITAGISKTHIKEMIWKIAFKEISGEFSKAVNSKISKPLSFYFARKGVTPNALSNAQFVLFLIASCFLLIDAHWALIVFAVLWQFSAGILDRCDGEVARIRNHESEAGGRFDMIIDDMRFGLPFIFLGGVLYYQTQNPLFLIALILVFSWFLALTLYEQNFMRKAGYTSRQVMYVDYLKLHGEQSQTSSFIKKYAPIVKGDIRTFYVFLLALFGLKLYVFCLLLIYLALVPISSFVGVLKFNKEYSKK